MEKKNSPDSNAFLPYNTPMFAREIVSIFRGLRKQPVRTLEVGSFAKRTDNGVQIEHEMETFGTKSILRSESSPVTLETGLTLCAAPHTPLSASRESFVSACVDALGVTSEQAEKYIDSIHEGATDIPLHVVQWWIPQVLETAPDTHTFSTIQALPEDLRTQLFTTLGSDAQRAIRTIYASVDGDTRPHTQADGVLWYGVFGHTPKDEREQTGRIMGPQSHVFLHDHFTYLEPGRLEETSQEIPLSKTDERKYISAQNRVLLNLIQPYMQQYVGEQQLSKEITLETHTGFKDEETQTGMRDEFYFRVNELDGISPDRAFAILTQTIAFFQEFYAVCANHFENGQDDAGFKQKIDSLFDTEIDTDAIHRIQSLLKELKPVSAESAKKLALIFPGRMSGGYAFDYRIDEDGKLKVTGIRITPRFSPKNIYEDLVGYQLVRPARH